MHFHAHLHHRAHGPNPAPAPDPSPFPDSGVIQHVNDFIGSHLGLDTLPSHEDKVDASNDDDPSAVVKTIFETMKPTFTGSIAGYTTLTESGPVHPITSNIVKISQQAKPSRHTTPVPVSLKQATDSPSMRSTSTPSHQSISSITSGPSSGPSSSPSSSPPPLSSPSLTPFILPLTTLPPTAVLPTAGDISSPATLTKPISSTTPSSISSTTPAGVGPFLNGATSTSYANAEPSASSVPPSIGSPNTAAATAGLAIGLISALVIVAFTLWLVFYRRRKRKVLQRLDDDEKIHGPFTSRLTGPVTTKAASDPDVDASLPAYSHAPLSTALPPAPPAPVPFPAFDRPDSPALAPELAPQSLPPSASAPVSALASTSLSPLTSRYTSAPRLSIRPVTQLMVGNWLDRRPSQGPAHAPVTLTTISASPPIYSAPLTSRAFDSTWEHSSMVQDSTFANDLISEEPEEPFPSLGQFRPVSTVSSLSTEITHFPQPSTIMPITLASVNSTNNPEVAAQSPTLKSMAPGGPLTDSSQGNGFSAVPMAVNNASRVPLKRVSSLSKKISESQPDLQSAFSLTDQHAPLQLSVVPETSTGAEYGVSPSLPRQILSPSPTSSLEDAGGPVDGNVYRVQLDFSPTLDDEMGLRAGSLIRIQHEYDDGWALCISLDRSRQGVVPRACLSPRPAKPRRANPGQHGPPPNPVPVRGPSPGLRHFQQPLRPSSPRHDGRQSPHLYERQSPHHDGRQSPHHNGIILPGQDRRPSPRSEGQISRVGANANSYPKQSSHLSHARQQTQFPFPLMVTSPGAVFQSPSAHSSKSLVGPDPRYRSNGNSNQEWSQQRPRQQSPQPLAFDGSANQDGRQMTGSAF